MEETNEENNSAVNNETTEETKLPTLNDALTGETKQELSEQVNETSSPSQTQPKEENDTTTNTNTNNEHTNDNGTPVSTAVINEEHKQDNSTTQPEATADTNTNTNTDVNVVKDTNTPQLSSSPKSSSTKKVTINDTQSKSPELSPSTYKKKSKLYKSGLADDSSSSSRRKLNSTFCEYNRTKKYDHFNSTYQRLQAKQQDREIKLEILRQEKAERELKHMKVVPTINKKSTKMMSNTTKSFYERQQSFEKRKKAKQDKLAELKRLKEEEELYKKENTYPKSARSGISNNNNSMGVKGNVKTTIKSKKQKEEKELLELKKKTVHYKKPKASQKQIDNTIERLYREEVSKRKENLDMLKSLYTPSFTPQINALPKERKNKNEDKQQGKGMVSKHMNNSNSKNMKDNDEEENEENGNDNNNDNEVDDEEDEEEKNDYVENNEVNIPIENDVNNDYSNFCKEATNNPQLQNALRGKLFKKKKK